jgi:hypothetical protein
VATAFIGALAPVESKLTGSSGAMDGAAAVIAAIKPCAFGA